METVSDEGRSVGSELPPSKSKSTSTSSSCYPRVRDVRTTSLSESGRRVRRVDFSDRFKCLLSSEPDQLLARLTWCIASGLADGADKIASFQQALVSSEKFRRFEDFIKLNNGAVHAPKLCVDVALFGFEVHISALSLAATKFVEILEAVELAQVDGRSITIDNSLALTPENEALAALLGAEHQFSKVLNSFNEPIGLSLDGLRDWIEQFLPLPRRVLVVRGAHDVDQLIKTAQKFVAVSRAPECQKPEISSKEDRAALSADIGRIRKIVVICSSALPRLVVTWLLTEPDANDYRCKPLNYLAYLMQQEYCGGLLHRLREQDLVNDIQVVVPEEGLEANSHWTVFRVVFMLSSSGVQTKERVVDALFSYLAHIQNNDVLEWIYREAAMSYQLKYEFASRQFRLHSRKTLCRAILDYAADDCIEGSHLMLEFDNQLIAKTISLLLESHYNIILEGDFDVSEFPDAEAHQNVGLILPMPTDWQQDADPSASWNFSRYTPNEFMPGVLTLHNEQRFVENYPNVISKSESHRLWYQFRNLHSPKVYCFVHFVRQLPGSVEWSVAAELACAILERTLLTRRTGEAGIYLHCSVINSGITISATAVNESLYPFVQRVVRQIQRGSVSSTLFQECRADLLESYRLRMTNAGYAENIFAQMHSGQLDLHQKIQAAQTCLIDNVRNVFQDLGRSLVRECFVYGNYCADNALNTIRLFEALDSDRISSQSPPAPSAEKRLELEDKCHPGVSSDRVGIVLLYYHWKECFAEDNALFFDILTDFLNSRIQVNECTIYCMPRSRAGETTGFTVELACDKDHLSRNAVLVEKTVAQLMTELSDDQNEIEEVFSVARKHLKRRREFPHVANQSCSLMAEEANAHFGEILNATFRFGRCFDDENAINCLEPEVFYNWVQESVACGYLRQAVCRVRVG